MLLKITFELRYWHYYHTHSIFFSSFARHAPSAANPIESPISARNMHLPALVMKKIVGLLRKTVLIILKTVQWLVVSYAVVFSIAGTIALFFLFRTVVTPINQVRMLRTSNPKETLYMSRCRASLGPGDRMTQMFVPIDSVSKNLQDAVLAAEDDGFYTHPGVDIEAILAAIEYNREHNGLKRGASTITQQLAKNLFLNGDKSFGRKYLELVYSVLLEKYLGKKRIFELYLNYAQWGKNIFGCEAASRHYYKKPSRNLSRTEAARLASILAMPERVSPLNENSTFIAKRIAVIANNMLLHHIIDDSGYVALTGSPVPAGDSLRPKDSTALQ